MQTSTIQKLAGTDLEWVRQGKGRPVLFLHPHIGMHGAAPFLDALATEAEVFAPSHPGFGQSAVPAAMTTVEDLAYFYLDLLDELDLSGVTLVGASFGGWIAAAMAVKNTSRMASLVLIDGLGVKVGSEPRSDLLDIFATPRPRLEELYFHDAAFVRRGIPELPDEDRALIARNWEATARYAWNPYMCDLKLRGRLHRIRIPSLVLWGEQDAIAPPAYGRAYAGSLPQAVFETLPGTGHFPYIEKPAAVAARVLQFSANRKSS